MASLPQAMAARQAPTGEPLVVPKGRSTEFLAPLPVRVLALPGLGSPAGLPGSGDLAGLADLLVRLGLKTLGDFAALPAPSVLGRFGTDGLLAHRLARGLGERSVRARLPPPDWAVSAELDPPAEQLHAAAFVGKAWLRNCTAVSAGPVLSAPVSLSKQRPSTGHRFAVVGAMTELSMRPPSVNECAGSWRAGHRRADRQHGGQGHQIGPRP